MKEVNPSGGDIRHRSLIDFRNPFTGSSAVGTYPYQPQDVKKFSSDGGAAWETWPPEDYSSHKKKKKSAALSAITLIAFLFFLNLLQSCLKEQMYGMNPTVSRAFKI